jgi:hypothetical protein
VVLVDTEWKRLSVTFTPKQGTDQAFVRISMQSAGTLWADAVQFERGDRATAYQPPAPETAGKDR